MHWQYVFFWQQEVLYTEHRFLHFASVAHTRQQYFALGEVNDHCAVRVGAVTLWNTFETSNVQDLPLFFVRRVVAFWQDEEVTAKQVLPGSLSGHFYWQIVLRVRADMHLRYEAVVLGQIFFYTLPQGIKLVSVERAVDVAPVDRVFAAWLFNDVFVHRRATCALASFDNQSAVILQFTFAAGDGLFYQERSR